MTDSTEERFPVLRLELRAAKHSLLRALDDRHHELQRMIASALDTALPALQAQIDRQMETALAEAIETKLHEAANDAVEKLAAALGNRFQDRIIEMIREKLE